jgi:hypothetical protein
LGILIAWEKLSLKKPGGLENIWESGGSEIKQGKIKIGELFRRNPAARSELQRGRLATQNTRPLLPFCVRKASG